MLRRWYDRITRRNVKAKEEMYRCLFCGERLIGFKEIDLEDFEGQAACRKCRLIFELRIENEVQTEYKLFGAIGSVNFVSRYEE